MRDKYLKNIKALWRCAEELLWTLSHKRLLNTESVFILILHTILLFWLLATLCNVTVSILQNFVFPVYKLYYEIYLNIDVRILLCATYCLIIFVLCFLSASKSWCNQNGILGFRRMANPKLRQHSPYSARTDCQSSILYTGHSTQHPGKKTLTLSFSRENMKNYYLCMSINVTVHSHWILYDTYSPRTH